MPAFRSLKPYLFAVLSMLFWGLSFVWFKIVVKAYEPITNIFLRLVISGSLLLLFLWVSGTFERIQRAHVKHFFALAFVQPLCYFLGESFGLQLVSPTISSVIIATIPLFTSIAAHYIVKETIDKSIVFGILFSFVGILIMLFNPDLSLNASLKGVMLLFVAVLSSVVYSILIRKITMQYSPVTIITYQNLIGALYFLPLFLIFDLKHFLSVKPTLDVWLALLQLAVFASTFAYVFYIGSIQQLGIIKSNVFTNLIPVFTAFFSFIMLGETFTIAKIVGMLLVMSGVFISQGRGLVKVFSRRNK